MEGWEIIENLHCMLTTANHSGPLRKLNIIRQVIETRYVSGDCVEVGCNRGYTSAIIQIVLNEFSPHKELHVYDSFSGLAGKTDKDETNLDTKSMFHEGQFATEIEDVKSTFNDYRLKLPTIHKGLMEDFTPEDFPEKISFAFIDLDLYEPTLQAIKLVWRKMSPGGVLVVDDYHVPPLPGVTLAVDEFFGNKVETPLHTTAMMRK